ncbi:hypothetical protein SCLCIDRAFT_805086 [Scleroderma citrinum Foug A]|uniref:DUF6533 domain-containing protein n=1 Tax=Scleroderma citrinum Foug A TaxID=1036808 RepID=A0A0C3E1W9_9AGAM|nr:hypothetical protein SCLCIDRAFT_805086 [Scleroderma citrinum Foug A]
MVVDILTFVHHLWLVRISLTVGYTLLWYDYFLTIEDEVEYIWKSPWTAVKIIYLLKRYGILFGQTVFGIQVSGLYPEVWREVGPCALVCIACLLLLLQVCKGYGIFVAMHHLLSREFAHNLVLLRTWALWGGSRRVPSSVIVGYIVTLISIIVGIAYHEDLLDIKLVVGVCYRHIPSE